MEDHQGQDGPSGHGSSERNGKAGNGNGEPVRSRWTPKPEQILILESIFNSGMVNPPKDETVRIRKLLEKFGSVGDANVFYWFQNRRSRSRRRQRQLQAASLAGSGGADQRNQLHQPISTTGGSGGVHAILHHNHNQYIHETHQTDGTANNMASLAVPAAALAPSPASFAPSYRQLVGSSSSGVITDDNLFSLSGQLGFPEIDHTTVLCPSETSNLPYQSGFVTVIINGVATEVPRGPLHMKAMFGEDVMLVHSSGVPLPINEFGFLLQNLQHGESYFLVSRQT